MRILSQENLYAFGIIDLPYEMCAFSMGYAGDESKFYIYVHFNGAKEQKIAQYSTKAKAIRAMEILQNIYSPKPDRRKPIYATEEPKAETSSNFYFQFPSDDEVEA